MTTYMNGDTGVSKVQDGVIVTADIGDGQVTPAKLSQSLTLGTAQATTSGTSKDFTGIPSWVKRITVSFNGVGHTAANYTQIQLGTGGVATVTGYNASSSQLATSSIGSTSDATCFFFYDNASTFALRGKLTLDKHDGNTWVANGMCQGGSSNVTFTSSGSIVLSGVLDIVRVTVTGGSFNAGSINIMYEG